MAVIGDLDEEGVAVVHLHVADQMHGFLTMGRVIRAQAMAVAQAAAALRHAFGGTGA